MWVTWGILHVSDARSATPSQAKNLSNPQTAAKMAKTKPTSQSLDQIESLHISGTMAVH